MGDLLALPVIARLPRLLSQIDRNPHSPTYGSCCRNWWHYRIEDISNAQFQELVLTLAHAWTHPTSDNPYRHSPELLAWIEAILAWTCRLQRPSGSFEEVYRGHDSYAATAFVTFCSAEAVLHLGDALQATSRARVVEMTARASAWLARTTEHLAGNQVAGAAAVHADLWRLTADKEAQVRMDAAVAQVTAMQHEEGWFLEYGGADIGYTTLAHSFLAHVHHTASSEQAGILTRRAAGFLRWFLHDDGTLGGIHGSRNTEYLVPLGAVLDATRCDNARSIRDWLIGMLQTGRLGVGPDNLDDRYFAYLSPYTMMAATLAVGQTAAVPNTADSEKWFPGARLWVKNAATSKLVVAASKGGVLRWDFEGGTVIDSGVFGRTGDHRTFTSQTVNPSAHVRFDGERIVATTNLQITTPVVVSPWRNIGFKAFNLLMPAAIRTRALTRLRKHAVSAGSNVGSLERSVSVDETGVLIEDVVILKHRVDRLEFQMGKERSLSFASTGFFQRQELDTGWSDSRSVGPVGPGRVVARRRLRGAESDWEMISATAGANAFETLRCTVIEPGLCTRCGTCLALCTRGNLRFDDSLAQCLPKPRDPAVCRDCDTSCDAACPGGGVDLPAMARSLFGNGNPDLLLGHARAFHVGWSNDPEIRARGSSGGAITGLLLSLLESGKIDAVACLVDDPDNPLQPRPILARDRATLMAAQQSRYSLAPVNQILAQTSSLSGQFAIVALPHQVHSLRLLQAQNHPAVRNIALILGSYCGVEQHFTAVADFLSKHGVNDLGQVTKVEYRAGAWPGSLRVTLRDGQSFEIEKFYANYMSLFYPVERSLLCVDLTNELADISFGDAWSPEFEDLRDGYSLVVVRSQAGEAALAHGLEHGALTLHVSDAAKALEMHSHGLYNKKIAVWARMELRRWMGKPIPDWGYTVDRSLKQRIVGLAIAVIFFLARSRPGLWLLSLLPLDLVGRIFLKVRRRWRRATRPSAQANIRSLFRVRPRCP